MKPIYTTNFLDLYHCDNMELMAKYPDNYFDLAIVDPPYGNNISGGRSINSRWNKKIDWNKCDNGWNLTIPSTKYFKELNRVSKNQIIWGGNYFANLLSPSECWLIWDKGQRDFSLADGEMAWTSFDKAMRITTIHRVVANQETKIHPTQKPVKLYEWILSNYAKENDKILDTHFGSGSIALAVDKANKLDKIKLHLTACELDKDYIDKSIDRISQNIKQTTMDF